MDGLCGEDVCCIMPQTYRLPTVLTPPFVSLGMVMAGLLTTFVPSAFIMPAKLFEPLVGLWTSTALLFAKPEI